MPAEEMYKKYEGNQTKDKVVDSSAGGLFKGEHWSEEYAKTLDWPHPSQDEINEMSAHRGTTCYDKMPDYIKDKPAITPPPPSAVKSISTSKAFSVVILTILPISAISLTS